MSDWTPTARTTVASGADAIRYSNSAVFPIPASPRSTSDRLSPRRIAETRSSSSAHSLARPRRSGRWTGPRGGLSIGRPIVTQRVRARDCSWLAKGVAFRLPSGGAELVPPLRLEERHEVVLRGPVLALRRQVVVGHQGVVIDLEAPVVGGRALVECLLTGEQLRRLVDRNPPRRVVGDVK